MNIAPGQFALELGDVALMCEQLSQMPFGGHVAIASPGSQLGDVAVARQGPRSTTPLDRSNATTVGLPRTLNGNEHAAAAVRVLRGRYVTVLAELVGHAFDLDALIRQFPTGDPRVFVDGEGTFLATDDLDETFADAGRMVEIAHKHVTRLNGWAALADAGYRPVRLGSQFHRESIPGAKHTHVLISDKARARDSVTVVQVSAAESRGTAFGVAVVTGGDPVEPPPPPGPRALALRNPDVDNLLAVVGETGSLTWSEMYKVFEIIRDALPGKGRDGLIATGWTTKADWSASTGSADHNRVAGIHEARHARMPGGLPKRTMTREEAQVYIRGLARDLVRIIS